MTDETRSTLEGIDHTNPYTDESFGDAMVYHRGPVVAADGGEETRREDQTGSASENSNEASQLRGPQLADVDHTPPFGEGVNRVYERGTEGRNESV
ncbi:hypothetical protein [Halocatena marina]|uniref:Uncharacterized protein n=1 Tax=Halocatena marina TaxID=2934937 RepID=A0ABD5YMM2_9EURY|nr:hypothetical protein [Halocatena marina]